MSSERPEPQTRRLALDDLGIRPSHSRPGKEPGRRRTSSENLPTLQGRPHLSDRNQRSASGYCSSKNKISYGQSEIANRKLQICNLQFSEQPACRLANFSFLLW